MWSATVQDTLDLLIEPQKGLTCKLLDYTKQSYDLNLIVMFSRPYRIGLAIDKYKSMLIVASSFSIVALLLYIKKLIYNYNTCIGCA